MDARERVDTPADKPLLMILVKRATIFLVRDLRGIALLLDRGLGELLPGRDPIDAPVDTSGSPRWASSSPRASASSLAVAMALCRQFQAASRRHRSATPSPRPSGRPPWSSRNPFPSCPKACLDPSRRRPIYSANAGQSSLRSLADGPPAHRQRQDGPRQLPLRARATAAPSSSASRIPIGRATRTTTSRTSTIPSNGWGSIGTRARTSAVPTGPTSSRSASALPGARQGARRRRRGLLLLLRRGAPGPGPRRAGGLRDLGHGLRPALPEHRARPRPPRA